LQHGGRNRTGAAIIFAVLILVTEFFGQAGDRRSLNGVRVDDAIDQFVDAHFLVFDLGGQFENVVNRCRAGRNGLHHVLEAIFDAFGDLDFAFAGQ
jgi:hypothetical protein